MIHPTIRRSQISIANLADTSITKYSNKSDYKLFPANNSDPEPESPRLVINQKGNHYPAFNIGASTHLRARPTQRRLHFTYQVKLCPQPSRCICESHFL
jgi:hypothetical protein